MNEWNFRERRTLRRLYSEGEEITLIAIALGRTIPSVRGEIRRMKLRRPPPKIDDVDRVPLSPPEVEIWHRQIREDRFRQILRLSPAEVQIWHEQERRERQERASA